MLRDIRLSASLTERIELVGRTPDATQSDFVKCAGDLVYPATINGGAVHEGTIQDDRRIQCSHCMARRGSCFVTNGSNNCPAGFDRQYEGYLYGSHYTHAAPYNRICVDHLNFDNTITNSPNSGAHFYPTRVHANTTTNVPANNGVQCAVCCGG